MRRNILLIVGLAFLILIPSIPAVGQALPSDTARFNPDVVTIWHKLGIPQGVGRFKKYRDSRINRKGLRPDKERKPPLLRIADPKNLAEGSPEMLKAAAKIKMDQDLAPQKLKALKYISTIGCSCYNKQAGLVEKALLEGMEDCTVEVRMAAINVVLSNAGNPCCCQGQCGTCCSKEVLKKLQEIAYKMDDNGCYVEPNPQVRSLAERALNQCPPLVEEKKSEPPKPPENPEKKPENPEKSGDENPESKKKESDSEPPQPDEPDSGSDSDGTTGVWGTRPINQVSSRQSFGAAWNDPALNELEIRGFVDSITQGQTGITVEFVKPFELPIGAQVVIAIDEFNASFGTVISSEAGSALINVEDYRLIENLNVSQRFCLGVLE
jgi:hypothetical protein